MEILNSLDTSLSSSINCKFLIDEFGFQSGDYFRLIHEDGLLILTKVPKEISDHQPPKPKPNYFDRLITCKENKTTAGVMKQHHAVVLDFT